ncbi:MAG: short-chain dehydrogenase/reductase SDR [Spirochaetes bacterium]|nr:MAG: short-chain dehydrogenase/reductase SDR [Spirochaetota bacterium]
MRNSGILAGTTALVTGGGKGIGRETARELGKLGAAIYICGRDKASLESAAASFAAEGIRAQWFTADVRDPAACKALVDAVLAKASRLDILVNNAGMSMRGTLEETDPTVMAAMAEINFLGPAYMTKYSIPALRKSGGSVVFVSSLTALHGLPHVGVYGASKIALRVLAESLRIELAGSGVHVGIVHVGFTENDPDKVVYAQDGSLSSIGERKNSQTQAQVARRIVNLILRRRREATLTALGKLAAFIYRFFPGAADRLLGRYVKESGQFGQMNRGKRQ